MEIKSTVTWSQPNSKFPMCYFYWRSKQFRWWCDYSTCHFDFSFAFWGFQIQMIFNGQLLHATITCTFLGKYKVLIISGKKNLWGEEGNGSFFLLNLQIIHLTHSRLNLLLRSWLLFKETTLLRRVVKNFVLNTRLYQIVKVLLGKSELEVWGEVTDLFSKAPLKRICHILKSHHHSPSASTRG